jgi:4,5-dihydroxyphthalate decarboxylase
MAPGVLEVFKRGSPRVRRLFPNYQEVEADYYRRTGIVPIMHMIVIRRRVYEANPWVARSLYDGFVEAKRLCYKRMDDTGAAAASLVWLQAHLEAERAVFGPDHWPYGFAPIRKTVEALTTYVYEQGLSDRQVAVEELFAPELLDPS